MRELSLFTGAGGGLLGTKLLGWEPVGYVEWNDYCQRVIAQRIEDGYLPRAPIFSDIRAFNRDGYAAAYQGMVDVITAGFPCQPFSVAGKREGADDDRNMWPATLDTIRAVRPRLCFLENVPGLVTSGYFGTILGGLAESGYDCRWRILSAAEVGAPHKRDRLWIVAHAGELRLEGQQQMGTKGLATRRVRGEPSSLDPLSVLRRLSMHDSLGFPRARLRVSSTRGGFRYVDYGPLLGGTTWEAFTGSIRMADGMDSRVDRLKAIGNGQVPAVAATAWHLLMEVDA